MPCVSQICMTQPYLPPTPKMKRTWSCLSTTASTIFQFPVSSAQRIHKFCKPVLSWYSKMQSPMNPNQVADTGYSGSFRAFPNLTMEFIGTRMSSELSGFQQLVKVMHVFTFDPNDKCLLRKEKNESHIDWAATTGEELFPVIARLRPWWSAILLLRYLVLVRGEEWRWKSLRLKNRSCKTAVKVVRQPPGQWNHGPWGRSLLLGLCALPLHRLRLEPFLGI